jgi:SNF2 family DNA or RNA helicase
MPENVQWYQLHHRKKSRISSFFDRFRVKIKPAEPSHLSSACVCKTPRNIALLTEIHPAQSMNTNLCMNGMIPRGHVQLKSLSPGDDSASMTAGKSAIETRVIDHPVDLCSNAQCNKNTETPLWKRLSYLLQVSPELSWQGNAHFDWPFPLFPYQTEGISVLIQKTSVLLADDMGLGKTVQAICALRILGARGDLASALIIMPASLLNQWKKEFRTWAPEMRICTIHGPSAERLWMWRVPAHVYLVTYETFRADFTGNPNSPLSDRIWDMVLLDEAQKIKNRNTDISRKCKQIPRHRAVAMTGTPLENHPDDLASIMEFLSPFGTGAAQKRLIPGPQLRTMHRETQLRRRKTEVLPQLPEKLINDIVLPLQPAQKQTYDKAEREGILRLKETTHIPITSVLELILRLKQICNLCPYSGQSSKLTDIRDRLVVLREEGHRALLFSQFTDARFGCKAVAQELSEFNPLIFTGEDSSKQKSQTIDTFRNNPDHTVLILSLRAGGLGLNLQEASYVFHFDRWWNPAVERQAEDRSHRMGQTMPVHVYRYICEGTIEERIDHILSEKRILFSEMIDGISMDLKSMLTYREILSVFGLAEPEIQDA